MIEVALSLIYLSLSFASIEGFFLMASVAIHKVCYLYIVNTDHMLIKKKVMLAGYVNAIH